MLITRIASALVLIPIVGLALYLGGYATLALVLLAALLAGLEYVQLLRHHGLVPPYAVALLLIAVLVGDAHWPRLGLLGWSLLLVPLAGLSAEVFRRNAPGSLSRWAHGVAGGLYIGLSMSCFIRLRGLEQGFYWVVVVLLGTWVCDTGAYLVGCTLGRRQLAPIISPKKTWEGAIGGLATGVLSVLGLAVWLLRLPVWQGVLLGFLLVGGATIGDLAESVIKRQVGVKDSGHLIPGHGGMLDRVDSLLFVTPIVYCFAVVSLGIAW